MKNHYYLKMKTENRIFYFGSRTQRNSDFNFVTKEECSWIFHSENEAEKERDYIRNLTGLQTEVVKKIHTGKKS